MSWCARMSVAAGLTVRGSTGARGDRSAEGTDVARGIDSAHSEVVRGMPFQGPHREGRACRCARLCEAGRRAAAAPDLIVVEVSGFDRRVPAERDLGAAWRRPSEQWARTVVWYRVRVCCPHHGSDVTPNRGRVG